MVPNIECWFGSFVVLQGIRTSIAKKPFIFCDFQSEGGGGVQTPFPPSGSAHGAMGWFVIVAYPVLHTCYFFSIKLIHLFFFIKTRVDN